MATAADQINGRHPPKRGGIYRLARDKGKYHSQPEDYLSIFRMLIFPYFIIQSAVLIPFFHHPERRAPAASIRLYAPTIFGRPK